MIIIKYIFFNYSIHLRNIYQNLFSKNILNTHSISEKCFLQNLLNRDAFDYNNLLKPFKWNPEKNYNGKCVCVCMCIHTHTHI